MIEVFTLWDDHRCENLKRKWIVRRLQPRISSWWRGGPAPGPVTWPEPACHKIAWGGGLRVCCVGGSHYWKWDTEGMGEFKYFITLLQIIRYFWWWLRLRYFCLCKNTEFLPKQQIFRFLVLFETPIGCYADKSQIIFRGQRLRGRGGTRGWEGGGGGGAGCVYTEGRDYLSTNGFLSTVNFIEGLKKLTTPS